MSNTLTPLLEKSQLSDCCEPLSIDQLEKLRVNLLELITQRKHECENSVLKRKGDRTLRDMRGLMAKAGISMSEFQAALQST